MSNTAYTHTQTRIIYIIYIAHLFGKFHIHNNYAPMRDIDLEKKIFPFTLNYVCLINYSICKSNVIYDIYSGYEIRFPWFLKPWKNTNGRCKYNEEKIINTPTQIDTFFLHLPPKE